MHQICFRPGSAPKPLQRFPRPFSWFKGGPTSKERGGKGEGRQGREAREGKKRRGWKESRNIPSGASDILSFYANVTTFGSLLSQIRLSSVTFVRRTHWLKLCELHSFSTSSISRHHTTVLNADVPNKVLHNAEKLLPAINSLTT